MDRRDLLQGFLETNGFDPSDLIPVAGDASNRRYFRLSSQNLIIMDAPPDKGEDVGPFIAITEWLRAKEKSAPEVLASDPDLGFLALEDLGDGIFARLCDHYPECEFELYESAVDLLVELSQEIVPSRLEAAGQPYTLCHYDETALVSEANLFIEWYLSGASGWPVAQDAFAEFRDLILDVIRPIASKCDVVVLRDYHAENLIWLPERSGTARTGLLDYQDALAGHSAYDLVSLLEDARRDTSPDLQAAMVRRYLDRTGIDADEFHIAYATLGAQRNLKIIGIFSRLCMRDGKRRYPDLIPRVWGHLMRDLGHPQLAKLTAWIAKHAPEPEARVLDVIRNRSMKAEQAR